jgi:hypothetical protein
LGHGIWDPLPSFARIAGAVVLQKKVATLGLHVKANMSLGKKKKKKKGKQGNYSREHLLKIF